jgi:hypothetical protein
MPQHQLSQCISNGIQCIRSTRLLERINHEQCIRYNHAAGCCTQLSPPRQTFTLPRSLDPKPPLQRSSTTSTEPPCNPDTDTDTSSAGKATVTKSGANLRETAGTRPCRPAAVVASHHTAAPAMPQYQHPGPRCIHPEAYVASAATHLETKTPTVALNTSSWPLTDCPVPVTSARDRCPPLLGSERSSLRYDISSETVSSRAPKSPTFHSQEACWVPIGCAARTVRAARSLFVSSRTRRDTMSNTQTKLSHMGDRREDASTPHAMLGPPSNLAIVLPVIDAVRD